MTIPRKFLALVSAQRIKWKSAHLVRFLCFENSENLLGFVFCGFCHGGQVQIECKIKISETDVVAHTLRNSSLLARYLDTREYHSCAIIKSFKAFNKD
jgi:hypothetical protein